MFHVKDGLYFDRLADGSVQIQKKTDGKEGAKVVMDLEIDPDSWASVVASVCAIGEDGNTFRQASNLHSWQKEAEPCQTQTKTARPHESTTSEPSSS